jgi:hypothetical protein
MSMRGSIVGGEAVAVGYRHWIGHGSDRFSCSQWILDNRMIHDLQISANSMARWRCGEKNTKQLLLRWPITNSTTERLRLDAKGKKEPS